MPIEAQSRSGATEAAKSAGYAQLPKGWYDGTIAEAKVQQYKAGKYAGKNYINVRVKVVKTATVGAGREFFVKIPLFSNWAPSAKYPDGYPTLYATFFSALGVADADIDAGRIPFEVSDLGGKAIGFFLSEEEADDYHDEDWNDVSRVRKSTAGTPSAVSETAGDVWGSPTNPTPAATEGDVWGSPAPAALADAASAGQGF